MIPTKTLRLSDGQMFKVTDSEAKAVLDSKSDLVYIKRIDQYINKKYITSISKGQFADYQFISNYEGFRNTQKD